MTLDPKALAVLADALRSALPESDAAEVLRWATHPEAVRELLKHASGEEFDSGGESRCAACFSHDVHYRTCRIAAAWRALGDPRGAADIERAHEEALREQERRTARVPVGVRRDGRIAFADELEGTGEGLRDIVTTGVVTMGVAPSPNELERMYGTRYPIGIAAENLRPGDLVEYRLGGPPTQPVRRASPSPADIGAALMRARDEAIEHACTAVLGHAPTEADRGALLLQWTEVPGPSYAGGPSRRLTIMCGGVAVWRIEVSAMGGVESEDLRPEVISALT